MPNISDFRQKLNARMGHVIDTGTQKLLRELLDYAEGLEKKTTLRPPTQPTILLGAKDIGENDNDKEKKKKTIDSTEAAENPKVEKPTQPVVLLGAKEIAESSKKGRKKTKRQSTEASGDPKPSQPAQPTVLLGAKEIGSRSGDPKQSQPAQPTVVLGAKGAKPQIAKKNQKIAL